MLGVVMAFGVGVLMSAVAFAISSPGVAGDRPALDGDHVVRKNHKRAVEESNADVWVGDSRHDVRNLTPARRHWCRRSPRMT